MNTSMMPVAPLDGMQIVGFIWIVAVWLYIAYLAAKVLKGASDGA